MRTIYPLSKKEKRDAEVHHVWVLSFLHRHGYSIDCFYDVAIMGYLKGIQDYHRKPGVKEKWCMSTICERAMYDAIATHLRDENRQKRKPANGLVSLDASFQNGDDNNTFKSLENTIISNTFEEDLVCADTVERMLNSLTERQRKIVLLKMEGYTHKEIKSIIDISLSTISNEIITIKKILSVSG